MLWLRNIWEWLTVSSRINWALRSAGIQPLICLREIIIVKHFINFWCWQLFATFLISCYSCCRSKFHCIFIKSFDEVLLWFLIRLKLYLTIISLWSPSYKSFLWNYAGTTTVEITKLISSKFIIGVWVKIHIGLWHTSRIKFSTVNHILWLLV